MDWNEQGATLAGGYHDFLVPAMFIPCAELLLDAAGVGAGADVLDVACGTGAATRAVAVRAGAQGRVVGVDLGDAMLDVARANPAPEGAAPIEYLQGDAAALPVGDAAFDVALCQHGIMFFPDRAAAVAEMARALRPGGTVAIAAWSRPEAMPAFSVLIRALRDHIGDEPAEMLASPFAVAPDELAALLREAGFEDVAVTEPAFTAHFASHRDWARRVLFAGPVGPVFAAAPEEQQRAVVEQATADLAPYATPDGALDAPVATSIALGRRPG
jgi:ubiquinone/menaquinone biosynthesis C-methylase UbiE